MIDHISFAVSDLARSAAFYDQLLEPLGYQKLVERSGAVGFGKKYPEFWLNVRPGMMAVEQGTGCHVCLRARSREAVVEFYERALAAGGQGDGAPGDRPGEMGSYFGAFVRDPDGNKIEAATFS
jgi:catechol 2,3-dioxygenase-like lactoylglutathione lyase family enzyme